MDIVPPEHFLRIRAELDLLPQHLKNKITGCFFILCRLKSNWRFFDGPQECNLKSEPFEDSFVVPFDNLLGAMKVVGDFFTCAGVSAEHHEKLVQECGTHFLKLLDVWKGEVSCFETHPLAMVVELNFQYEEQYDEKRVQQLRYLVLEDSAKKKCRSLSSAEIQLLFLKIRLFKPVEGEANCKGEANCGVCSEPFTEGSRILSLQCSHVFHAKCLISWFYMEPQANSGPHCPLRIDR